MARRRTEVLLLEVERGQAGLLAAVAVVEVVVIEAKHGGGVGNERVRVRVAALRGGRLAAEEGRHAAHERRLAAARVRGEADDDRAVTRGAGDDVALRSANFRGPPRASRWSRRSCEPRGAGAHVADMVMVAILLGLLLRGRRRDGVGVCLAQCREAGDARSLHGKSYPQAVAGASWTVHGPAKFAASSSRKPVERN